MLTKAPILCIDDDDQYLVGQVLYQLGLPNPVLFFSNGQAALDYLETTSDRSFLIFCDINMPLLNGLEFRKRINASDYLRKKSILFVFLTTTASQQSIKMAYEKSVQGFYQKALSYQELSKQIRPVVEYWQNCLHPNSQFR
jgi:CheY-like chemotaxis protein